jgi:hypothetical protein
LLARTQVLHIRNDCVEYGYPYLALSPYFVPSPSGSSTGRRMCS